MTYLFFFNIQCVKSSAEKNLKNNMVDESNVKEMPNKDASNWDSE